MLAASLAWFDQFCCGIVFRDGGFMSVMGTVERTTMAKRMGRPPNERDEVTIRVLKSMAKKLKAMSDDRGITVSELAEEMFASSVDRAYAQMLRRLDGGEK